MSDINSGYLTAVVTDQKSSPKDEDQTTLVSASASDASVTGDADVTDVTASETVEENTSDVTAADKTDEPETTATFDNTTTVTIDSIESKIYAGEHIQWKPQKRSLII